MHRLRIALPLLVLAAGLLLLSGRASPRVVEAPPGEVCLFAPATPYDPGSGLERHAARPVPAEARCPVCGMFPARSPDWAAQVVFDNGDAYFFDSPLSLFLYLQDVARYSRGRSAAQIAARYVRVDQGAAWLAADRAVYVLGSSAAGPMRAGNLPAFSDADAARRFAGQRGGELLRAGQITAQMLSRLDGRSAHH